MNHHYIGTEHLLLGLVREGEGMAAKVLSNLGVELNKVCSTVEFIIGRGDRIVLGEIGLTSRAKKVIELAVDEARRLNHHYIGTEHLLLGLVREGEGIAAGVLESLGVNLEKARTQTVQVLSQARFPTPEVNPPIRLFVSSTFTDFVFERELLQRAIFPRLRSLCAAAGCRFQPIDLRWGVSQEASNDKRTLAICLEEVARCQRLSPDLNFLILLGERYGSCHLPERIPSEQVARLWPYLPEAARERFKEAYVEDHNALPTYVKDDNALPAEYILLPSPGTEDMQWAEESLRAALAQATEAAGFAEEERLPFVASTTHLEIQRGLLEAGCDPSATLCAFRSLTSMPEGALAVQYGEPHPERRAQLEALKRAIEQRLGVQRIWRYTLPVESLALPLDQAARIYAQEYQALAEQLYTLLEQRVQEALARRRFAAQTRNPAAEAHHQFAAARTSVVVGREDALEKVAVYLAGSTPQPLVVTGASGVGKSTLLARAVEDLVQAHPQAVVVTRYISITPGTGSLAELLVGLRRELAERYGQAPPEPLGDLSQLVAAVATQLRTQAAPAERPLLLIVDALDQLGDQPQRVDWLPPTLAPNVRVVVSVRADRRELDTLCIWLPAEQILPLDPLTRAQGAAVLRQWLASEGRRLTLTQETAVLDGFAPEGASAEEVGIPLYLRLAFEQARAWRSFKAVEPLPPTAQALLEQYLEGLEQPGQHGRELVAYALGYVAAAKHGLAEDELLDLLSHSETVRTALRKLSPGSPPVEAERPLPMALWARLAADLERYLTEREADGARLVTFYHQQVRAEAERRYLDGAKRAARHAELADYFGEQPYQMGEGGTGIWNRRKLAELAYEEALAGPEASQALETTLTDGRFLEGKLAMEGVSATLADLTLAPRNEDIVSISRAIRAGAIILARDPTELPNQISGRVGQLARLHDLPERTTPWLHLRSPSLTPPDPALLHILQGHTDDVTGCALSADGALALSASADETLRLWDTASGETLRFLEGHSNPVTSCALSADGKLALSGDKQGILWVWDTASGETLLTFQGHTSEVTACALSGDGSLALSGSRDGTQRLWETAGGETRYVWLSEFSQVARCMLSKDGKLALSYSIDMTLKLRNRTLQLWDTTSNKTLHNWKFFIVTEVADCALSADGSRVLIASNLLGGILGGRATLQVWDVASGRRIYTLKGFKGAISSCALNADGSLALSGLRTAFLGYATAGWSSKWLLGRIIGLFGVFENFEGSTLRLWDIASGGTRRILQGHKDSVARCALSEDGKLALSVSSNLVDSTSLSDPSEHRALRLWNTVSEETQPTQERHAGHVLGCALSADGHLALSFAWKDQTLRVWDTASGRMLRTLKSHMGDVRGCALSADGRVALSVAADGTLRVWDTASGEMVRFRKIPTHTHELAGWGLSADGRLILSPHVMGLRLWDAISGQILTAFLPKKAGSITASNAKEMWRYRLSADGRLALFVSKDGMLRIWDTERGHILRTLEGQVENMSDCALSADGRRALVACEDGTLRLWDTSSGRALHTLAGHTGIVPGCALSANGHLALSASWDKTLRLWDASGQEIARWTHDIPLSPCALSANGQMAVAGDIEGGVHFLEVMGVVRGEDVAAAEPTESWLVKQPRKLSLLERLSSKW